MSMIPTRLEGPTGKVSLLAEAGSRKSNVDHDIPAEKAFDDILEQAAELAGGGGRSRNGDG
jgi:hypothetical protein